MSEVFIFEKLVKKLAEQKGIINNDDDEYKNETVINALKAFVAKTYNNSINKVISEVDTAARNQVLAVLGLEYDTWRKEHRWERDSLLRTEILNIVKPKIDEVASESVKLIDYRFRPTQDEKNTLREKCRQVYHNELMIAVQERMRVKIAEKAKRDAAQLFEDIETATLDVCTIDDVVAYRFTKMMLEQENADRTGSSSISFDSFLRQMAFRENIDAGSTEK